MNENFDCLKGTKEMRERGMIGTDKHGSLRFSFLELFDQVEYRLYALSSIQFNVHCSIKLRLSSC